MNNNNDLPLGVYTRYDRLGASSRCRYFDYKDAFEAAGFQAEFHPFFGNAYLERFYRTGRKSHLAAAKAMAKRFYALLRLPERLLIEYELLPELAYRWEKHFLRGKHYVLNFDDNVWEKYTCRPALSGKYDSLIRGAAGVVAANDFLMERIAPLNPNAVKIPTAVNLDSYPVNMEKFSRFTVAWIGTPVTYAYLELHAATLRAMAQAVDFELLVIARKDLARRSIEGVRTRFEEWSPQAEGELLARSHVGIMPLPANDPFAAGKSAFKLIQYLAAGLPAIASPIGENRGVLRSGETGLFATTPKEWADALLHLTEDNHRQQLSENARLLAYEYSTQKYAPIYTGFLKSVL